VKVKLADVVPSDIVEDNTLVPGSAFSAFDIEVASWEDYTDDGCGCDDVAQIETMRSTPVCDGLN